MLFVQCREVAVSYLCEALKNTGLAGMPEEYFLPGEGWEERMVGASEWVTSGQIIYVWFLKREPLRIMCLEPKLCELLYTMVKNLQELAEYLRKWNHLNSWQPVSPMFTTFGSFDVIKYAKRFLGPRQGRPAFTHGLKGKLR